MKWATTRAHEWTKKKLQREINNPKNLKQAYFFSHSINHFSCCSSAYAQNPGTQSFFLFRNVHNVTPLKGIKEQWKEEKQQQRTYPCKDCGEKCVLKGNRHLAVVLWRIIRLKCVLQGPRTTTQYQKEQSKINFKREHKTYKYTHREIYNKNNNNNSNNNEEKWTVCVVNSRKKGNITASRPCAKRAKKNTKHKKAHTRKNAAPFKTEQKKTLRFKLEV